MVAAKCRRESGCRGGAEVSGRGAEWLSPGALCRVFLLTRGICAEAGEARSRSDSRLA